MGSNTYKRTSKSDIGCSASNSKEAFKRSMNHYAVKNLFGIEGLNIAWYGIIITFGMILGFMLALRRCRKTGVEPDHLYNLALWLMPVCILCARAYYVLFKWEQYKDCLLYTSREGPHQGLYLHPSFTRPQPGYPMRENDG